MLILGVEDDHTLTGHRYPPDAIVEMLAVPENRLIPPLPRGYTVGLDGVELLVFEVESALRAVMVQGDGYPFRIVDSTPQFSEEKINAIKDQGLVETAEARRATVAVDALDAALLARAREASGSADDSIEAYLIRRRLADRFGTTLVLREAAVLLFAARPETIAHPNAGVRVFRVAGTERLTGARHNVQEFPRIEGNLVGVLAEARRLLETLIQRSARLRDLFFEEMPEYPTFAWQEALVNAVAHRDYAIQGQSVEVWLYTDRLEILSPGAPPEQVSLDELRLGHAAHASRNPRIARVLAELGAMRDQGEGIPRMFEEMELSFLPVPELDVVSGRFRVVLRKDPIFHDQDPAWLASVRQLPISVTQKRAMVGLLDRSFSNGDYCALNALDRDSAYREIEDLVQRGLLAVEGTGAATQYQVVRTAVPTPTAPPSALDALRARMTAAGFITNADYREAFGVDRRTAKLALARWVAEQVVVREGERRAARYRPGPSWPPL